jgi:hypothetical protein
MATGKHSHANPKVAYGQSLAYFAHQTGSRRGLIGSDEKVMKKIM